MFSVVAAIPMTLEYMNITMVSWKLFLIIILLQSKNPSQNLS